MMREIDIMEYNANWGPLEGFTSSIHLDYGTNYNTAHIEFPISDMDTTYHLYALEWYSGDEFSMRRTEEIKRAQAFLNALG